MTTLKDMLRDFQKESTDIVQEFQNTEMGTEEIRDMEQQLEDRLEMTIDAIVARLIGQEV